MRTRALAAMAACTLATGWTARAQTAATKVGVINIQEAIIRTAEGQKTAKELTDKYAPRQADLEKKKRELEDLQAQLSKGRNTLSDEARNKLIRDIDQKSKALTRDNEDASAEYQQEEGKLINAIGQKLMGVVVKYATDNGYAIILDISGQQSPVLYAINSVDITNEIVTLFDKSQGVAPAASKPAPAPAPPATRTPITRPPTAVPKTPPPAAPKTPSRPPAGGTPTPRP